MDIEKTKHYTTKAEQICGNLIQYIPENVSLVEPFVGNGDLLQLFPRSNWEMYDIEDKGNNVILDTLKNPPNYKSKWVITNPPYLAKNKTKDKSVYLKYNTDDLYKASLISILDCSGGILIIPANFFTDERTQTIRNQFLNRFKILELNVFTEPVFDTTTYSVCSFAFEAKENKPDEQVVRVNIFPKGEKINISLSPSYGYRIAGDFYYQLNSVQNIFNRLVGSSSNQNITDIKLYAIDTRTDRIRLEYETNRYEGKDSDRTYATLTCKYPLTKEQQLKLIEEFNSVLENFRKKYYDLPMTNYRDYNRKRIGFTFAYRLLSYIYNKEYNTPLA